MEIDFLFLKKFVDLQYIDNEILNHEKVSKIFEEKLSEFSKEEFCDFLICTGYIPDLYFPDSSQETLYSKLIEVIVAHWAKRMGFKSEYIKTKGSYEDIKFELSGKIIVCDAKSFRLSRSQVAPNVKDFIKLEDYRKWLSRYSNRLGGLVTYPCTHEWKGGSDAYQYCTDKNMPTVMLPYKYLAFLLYYSDKYDTSKLIELWNYEEIFPMPLKKKDLDSNKFEYWKRMKEEIIRLTNTSLKEFIEYEKYSQKIIENCIKCNLKELIDFKNEIITDIQKEVSDYKDIEELKKEFIQFKVSVTTESYDQMIKRIVAFRLKRED